MLILFNTTYLFVYKNIPYQIWKEGMELYMIHITF